METVVQSHYREALKRAGHLAQAADHHGALAAYDEALRLAPCRADAHYEMGLLHHKLGRVAEAIACFERAAELAPEDATVWNNLGVLYYGRGELAKAERAFRRAIGLDQRYADAWYGLGKTLEKLEHEQEAAQALHNCLLWEPHKAKAEQALIALERKLAPAPGRQSLVAVGPAGSRGRSGVGQKTRIFGHSAVYDMSVANLDTVLLVVQPGSACIEAPANAHITRALETGHFYEARMLDYIRRSYPPGLAYVDAGAHIGNHTLFFAVCCKARRVDAFEPHPLTRSLLERNVDRNGVTDIVRVHPEALGARPGKGRLVPGKGRLVLRRGVLRNFSTTGVELCNDGSVEVTSLDEAISQPIDILKIDVEGSSEAAIRGGLGCIERWRPDIFVECLDQREYEGVAELLAGLQFAEGRYEATHRFNATPTYLFTADAKGWHENDPL